MTNGPDSTESSFWHVEPESLDDTLPPTTYSSGAGPRPGVEKMRGSGDEQKTVPVSSYHFGPYELLEEVGRGGMGVVYRARERNLGRIVAVKTIPISQVNSSLDKLERFKIEARALAQIRHPNIVGVHSAGVIGADRYIAMDFIAGENLASRLKWGPITIAETLALVRTLALATSALHAKGIIHRDLKPSNILIGLDGQPVITDFGLAKIVEDQSDLTLTGKVFGTPMYMSPEQALESRNVDEHTDIYSLGAILYEMLTGRPPFVADSSMNVLMQVISSEPTLPRELNPAIPRALQAICLRCLEKQPDQRYPTAQLLAADLERMQMGDDLEIHSGSVFNAVRRRVRRHPGVYLRCCIFLFMAFVVQLKYMLLPLSAPADEHYSVIAGLFAWIGMSVLFHQISTTPRYAILGKRLWGSADIICFTCILILADHDPGPTLIGYPALLACAGLTFDLYAIGITGATSLIFYFIYLSFQSVRLSELHHHVIFVLALIGIMASTMYMAWRVRMLTDHHERQNRRR